MLPELTSAIVDAKPDDGYVIWNRDSRDIGRLEDGAYSYENKSRAASRPATEGDS